jgi:hypothetical protein
MIYYKPHTQNKHSQKLYIRLRESLFWSMEAPNVHDSCKQEETAFKGSFSEDDGTGV